MSVSSTNTLTGLYTYTVPANTLGTSGNVIEIDASGQFLFAAAASPTFKVALMFGAQTVVSANIAAVTSSSAPGVWHDTFTLSNASGTSNNQIGSEILGATNGKGTNSSAILAVGTSTIDTTQNASITLEYAPGTSSASNIIWINNVSVSMRGATTTVVTGITYK